MRPEEWRQRWLEEKGDELVVLNASAIEMVRLEPNDRLLLVEAGLPDGAAPWLTFGDQTGMLEELRQEGYAPAHTATYVEIGFNGSGDPVCLDTETGSVFYLNHDDDFRPVFINSSVSFLAEFLLLFRAMIKRVRTEFGNQAYLDGTFPPSARDAVVESMRGIDPRALEPSTMWFDELVGE